MRHAEAVARYNRVSILHIITDNLSEKKIEINYQNINNVNTYIAYVKRIKNLIFKGVLFLKAFRTILKQIGDFDIVHVNRIYPLGIFAVYLKTVKKKPYIISEHWTGYHTPLNSKIGFGEYLISKLIVQKSSYVCPVSNNLRDAMISFGLFGNYKTIPNVVDCKVFKPHKQKNEIFTIIHVSNMKDTQKNISGILNAVKEFSLVTDNFKLVLIGEGSEKYKKKVNQLKIHNKVQFFEHISHKDVASKMSKAHVFILFSNYENLPCVILESFSCGTPVISTNVGGIPEYFPKNFGFLIDKNNKLALKNALIEIYKTSFINTNEMHNYALKHFGKKNIAFKFQSLYEKLINE